MKRNAMQESVGAASGDLYCGAALARRSVADLHAHAQAARLIKQYRRAHPHAGLRVVAATGLRRLADRLAPMSPGRVVPSGRVVGVDVAGRPAASL